MSTPQTLDDVREAIDALDLQILQCLSERAKCAEAVAEIKQRTAGDEAVQFYRPEREAKIYDRLAIENPGPLGHRALVRIYQEIISSCLELERPLRVAYLGPEGTFSELAVKRHFGRGAVPVARASIAEVFASTTAGICDFGVVPIENSVGGAITDTLDLLLDSNLSICGEVMQPIVQNFASQAKSLAQVTEIVSHAASLSQCRRWLGEHLPDIPCRTVSSNAEAARLASENPQIAAICGQGAAARYELPILHAAINDRPDNTTRFLVIGSLLAGPSGHDKTSILISTENSPGALYSVLEPLSRHGVNMSRIESRPSRQGLWEYAFFVDVEGHRDDECLAKAFAELESQSSLWRVLGSYPVSRTSA